MGHNGASHFAECRENRPVTVWEMLINLLKSPIPRNGEGSGKVIWNPYPEQDHHQKLISSSDWQAQVSVKSADYFCSNPAHRQTEPLTDWQTDRHDRVTSALVDVTTISIYRVAVAVASAGVHSVHISVKRPPMFRPSQHYWLVPWICLKAAIVYTYNRHLLLLLSSKADTLNWTELY